MKIQIGEIYMDKVTNEKSTYFNKTRKYLAPCLMDYGAHFIVKFNNVFKIAVGIGDIVLSNRKVKHEKHLFALLDSTIAPNHFIEFLEWIRLQPMYQDDYVFDNIQRTISHMVILKLPEKYYNTFETFKLGEYSKMYNKEDVEKFFSKTPNLKKILIKDHNYKFTFVGKLNRRWGSNVKASEWEGELAFPPEDELEIFNYYLKKKDNNG